MICYNDVIIVNLKIDGILGFDFMKKNKCLVDVNNEIFIIKGYEK